jgi:hypothetical protein
VGFALRFIFHPAPARIIDVATAIASRGIAISIWRDITGRAAQRIAKAVRCGDAVGAGGVHCQIPRFRA